MNYTKQKPKICYPTSAGRQCTLYRTNLEHPCDPACTNLSIELPIFQSIISLNIGLLHYHRRSNIVVSISSTIPSSLPYTIFSLLKPSFLILSHPIVIFIWSGSSIIGLWHFPFGWFISPLNLFAHFVRQLCPIILSVLIEPFTFFANTFLPLSVLKRLKRIV